MKFATAKHPVPCARRVRRIAGNLTLLLAVAIAGAGCIIIPVPSLTPDSKVGIIEDGMLESLVGLNQTEVNGEIGYPDYSGRRGNAYVMVYQGETRHSTDVYMFVSAGYAAGGGKVDEGTSKTLHCQVLELDAERIVQDYDVIIRPFTGITRRQDSGYVLTPVNDCSKVVWGQDARDGISSGQIEETKRIMQKRERIAREREAREARRVASLEMRAKQAELEQRARQGDANAAIELAELTGSSAPVKRLAQEGDATAAYAMYAMLSDERETIVDAWKYLCSAASAGNAKAQAEVGYWHRQSVFEFSLKQLPWIRTQIGIRPNDRIAYAWYTLAAAAGDPKAMNVRNKLIAPRMTAQDVTEAQRLAAAWKPGDCPSADNRLPTRAGT